MWLSSGPLAEYGTNHRHKYSTHSNLLESAKKERIPLISLIRVTGQKVGRCGNPSRGEYSEDFLVER